MQSLALSPHTLVWDRRARNWKQPTAEITYAKIEKVTRIRTVRPMVRGTVRVSEPRAASAGTGP